MICQKCFKDFPEKEIQVSHDIPVYMFNGKGRNERRNKADKFGRHNLCKKCHDIYEKMIASIMIKPIPENLKLDMRHRALSFANVYFIKKEEKENGRTAN